MESERTAEEHALAWLGAASILVGVLANEHFLARILSADGAFEASTLLPIRVGQGVCIALGLSLIFLRARLRDLFARIDAFKDGTRALGFLLGLGIVLRIAVFVCMFPTNNDPHWDFVRFIVENGRLPIATETTLGFQPPLYYLLAAPFALGASLKLTQALSLVLSIVNLILIHSVLSKSRLLESHRARCHALVLAAVLPQFVLFSGFISNDALAFPLGTLLYILAFRYIDHPNTKHLVWLGVVQGLALLTKGTLIGNVPVLLGLIAAVQWRGQRRVANIASTWILFGAITGLVGCYKFVENQINFGTPVISNDIVHQEWVYAQQGTYRGLSSLTDVNVLTLARYPFIDSQPNVRDEVTYSIPLLFYGTFWSAYIKESSFDATRRHPLKYVVSALYLAAVVPTLLMLAGISSRLWKRRGLLANTLGQGTVREFTSGLRDVVCVLFVAMAFVLVVKWGMKHDAWSFFQARLVFPAFLSLAVALGWGVELVGRRGPLVRYACHAALIALYVLIGAYFAIELIACV